MGVMGWCVVEVGKVFGICDIWGVIMMGVILLLCNQYLT